LKIAFHDDEGLSLKAAVRPKRPWTVGRMTAVVQSIVGMPLSVARRQTPTTKRQQRRHPTHEGPPKGALRRSHATTSALAPLAVAIGGRNRRLEAVSPALEPLSCARPSFQTYEAVPFAYEHTFAPNPGKWAFAVEAQDVAVVGSVP